jgi:hypothetical protein
MQRKKAYKRGQEESGQTGLLSFPNYIRLAQTFYQSQSTPLSLI